MTSNPFPENASDPSPGSVTCLLHEARRGNRDALNDLLPLVYRELHRQAVRSLRNEGRHPTLQPTMLVHEAYLRLVGARHIEWEDRQHFFAVAARTMRRVLVDYARTRNAQKRSAGDHVRPRTVDVAADDRLLDVLILDEALDRLSAVDPRQERVVELRVFAGMSVEETAGLLGVSPRTVKSDWQMARAWLTRELRGQGDGASPPQG